MNDSRELEVRPTGWDNAVNLVTPIGRSPWVRGRRHIAMWLAQRPWVTHLLRAMGVMTTRPVDEYLRRLNHLHFARWSIVHKLPRAEGAAKETGRYTLLLFTSYFDFGWRQYLGSFIETSGDRLSKLWGDLPEWRGPSAGFRRFENLVVDQQVEHAHLFAAYPDLGCNDVRAIVRIHRECRRADFLDGAPCSPALRRRLRHCLGSIPVLDPHEDRASGDHIDGRIGARELPCRLGSATASPGVTCLIPFAHEKQSELRCALDQLNEAPPSPFSQVAGTHFARLAIIGESHLRRGSVPPLANGYLLLSGEIDGVAEDWLADVAKRTELENVWAACHGVRRVDIRAALLGSWLIAPNVEFVDHPATTVNEIFEAIETYENLMQSGCGGSGPGAVDHGSDT